MAKTEERHCVYYFICPTKENKMSNKIDMVGRKIGKLTILEMIYDEEKQQYSHCRCLCDCGNEVIKRTSNLRSNRSKKEPSCGCDMFEYKRRLSAKNVVGKKFGRLLVLEEQWNRPHDKNKLVCQCECGNTIVAGRNGVLSGDTKSCGCLQKDVMREMRHVDDSGYISDFGVKILNPYARNDKGQLIWECECNCGKHFYELPARIKNNHVRSCGCLVKSSMETFIANVLDESNVNYISQYTFIDCVNEKGNKLRFDFAVIKDGKVFCLIEYDGKQHYESVEYFGGDTSFETRQRYDAIKNEYCRNHSIQLLRLPYYMSNEEITDNINKIINTMNP